MFSLPNNNVQLKNHIFKYEVELMANVVAVLKKRYIYTFVYILYAFFFYFLGFLITQ